MIDLTKVAQWLILLVVVSAGYAGWRQYERNIGKRDLQIAQLEQSAKRLDSIIRVDSVRFAKRDTVKLFHTIAQTDTILQRLIDTAIVHHQDTVIVERRVLVTADSAIKACRETVTDCAKLAESRAVRIRQLDSLLQLTKGQRPSILSRCGVSGGYGVQASADGKVSHGVAVVAGCRIFP